ncbi:MAG TPA: 2-C-methyl-D-erythritol 4-phosphate cytidylyltransferase, partial [Aquificaceae bacterium]|nr:2-C-methyl-D-erythritol 4-phosphate cytidylyltransferase [Aquificaceae bacterium]
MKACILLAAGEGKRIGFRKQFIEIHGKPLFMYSLEKALRVFEEVLLVLPRDSLTKVQVPEGVKKVEGGKERQDSVLNGVLETEAEVVVIHDAARPMVTEDMFREVSRLGEYDGKIVALPSRDTIKEVSGEGVLKTVDRSHLWLAQTPQAFRRKVLLECHFRARNEGFYGTDDASLLERYGYRVGIVMGSYWNVKVTYREDIPLLERLLSK